MAELVICDDRRNLVKILGRKKMDFIKCGGYKVNIFVIYTFFLFILLFHVFHLYTLLEPQQIVPS